jgi:hypothetical protein
MTLTEMYNEVSRRADTAGTKINVAETKRVLSEMFGVLNELEADEAVAVVAAGLRVNRKKKGK